MAIYIVKVYADLVEKGKKSMEEVPENLRAEVQQILDSRKNDG